MHVFDVGRKPEHMGETHGHGENMQTLDFQDQGWLDLDPGPSGYETTL